MPARVHYGLIDIEIMRGIFPSFVLPFMPGSGPHSWVEVELGGEWKPVDSYINDIELYLGSRRRLTEEGRSMGYSLACVEGKCSCDFNFGEEGFVHMGGVVADHGVWEDASDYFQSDLYVRMKAHQRWLYPLLAWMANRNIDRIRAGNDIAPPNHRSRA
jgi:hypothetical protein